MRAMTATCSLQALLAVTILRVPTWRQQLHPPYALVTQSPNVCELPSGCGMLGRSLSASHAELAYSTGSACHCPSMHMRPLVCWAAGLHLQIGAARQQALKVNGTATYQFADIASCHILQSVEEQVANNDKLYWCRDSQHTRCSCVAWMRSDEQ